MYHPDDFKEVIDYVEEEVFQLDIIKSFEVRGWGLYQLSTNDTTYDFHSYYDLKPFVEMGREKSRLLEGMRYILLPLNEDDTNWEIIRDLTFMLISQGRGPYFVDFEEGIDETGERWIQPIGVYFVDSVRFEFPNVHLIIDPYLSRVKKQRYCFKHPEIIIPLNELNKIRKQLMLSLRII